MTLIEENNPKADKKSEQMRWTSQFSLSSRASERVLAISSQGEHFGIGDKLTILDLITQAL